MTMIAETSSSPGARVSLPVSKKNWTDAELEALPKDNGKYELINGELTLISPAVLPGRVAWKILRG